MSKMEGLDLDACRVPDAQVGFPVEEAPDVRLATVWENVTDRDVVMPLWVGTTHGRKPTNREEKTGERVFRIPAHSSRAISVEFDGAIQHISCEHPACTPRKRLCRNEQHRPHWTVVGGYGHGLIRKGTQPLRVSPLLAEKPQSLAAPPTPTQPPKDLSAEEAALKRAAERRGAK